MSQPTAGDTSTRYRFDPSHSRFTVQAFVTGLMSFLGHSPTFAVREFEGFFHWSPNTSGTVNLRVRADSLALLDQVRPADRTEIEGRMRREVLEIVAHPEASFEATEIVTTAIAPPRYRVRLGGSLSLHGVTRRETMEAELLLADDRIRLVGEFPLRMSAYQVRPVKALGGAIQLRDTLRLAFDLAAEKESA